MKPIEIEGKTIDEAIEKACREFNVPREKLNIEILSEGSSGLLGLGARKARIKAALLTLDMELDDNIQEPAQRSSQDAPGESPRKASAAEAEPVSRDEATSSTENVPQDFEDGAVALRARELLEGILVRMGLDFPVTMEETRDAVTFRITGDGSGILIGKGGQTLDAIQYVVNKAVGVSGEDRRRIVLDTEEYRGRREDYLVSLAAKLADKVKKTHKPITVNYMNARDRRIIHLALKGDVELVTKSRGEGSYRKIVILPAKRNGNRRALLKNQDT